MKREAILPNGIFHFSLFSFLFFMASRFIFHFSLFTCFSQYSVLSSFAFQASNTLMASSGRRIEVLSLRWMGLSSSSL